MFGIVKPAVWPTEAENATESVEQTESEAMPVNAMTLPINPAPSESDVEVVSFERLSGEPSPEAESAEGDADSEAGV